MKPKSFDYLRAATADEALEGLAGAGGELDDALNALAWDLGGYDDIHATARYRRELVRRLGRRAIEEARACRS